MRVVRLREDGDSCGGRDHLLPLGWEDIFKWWLFESVLAAGIPESKSKPVPSSGPNKLGLATHLWQASEKSQINSKKQKGGHLFSMTHWEEGQRDPATP